MSILLDALKKSEAQRQLGKTPTLQTPVSTEESTAGDNRIWIPAMMLLLAAGLIWWIGAAQYHHPDAEAGKLASTPAVIQQEARTDMPPQQDDNAQRSARTPVMDFTETRPPPVSASAPGKRIGANAWNKADLKASAPEPNTVVQAPAVAEESLAVARSAAVPSVNKQSSAAKTDQKPTDRLEPFVAEPIGYWQVPQSVRQDLPEMHITVLVYAEKPEDRFLLINGERLREKEELSEGLVLEEIRRDRAIFSYRSYHFHLKN